MSYRFAKFYQRVDKFNFRALVQEWSPEGVTLANPITHRITSLSDEGDQVETSPELLETALANGLPVTFQLWLAGDTDISCHIRLLNDHRVVEEYALDGLYQNELDKFFQLIVRKFKMKAVEDANPFFVGDREGYTIVLNWDQLSVNGRYEDRTCPDVLGIPIARLGDFEQCVDTNSTTVHVGFYLVIMRKPLSPA